MKSEHRHELKTNDLAKSLLTFQDYVKAYGGRVALGVLIVVLVIVLIMQRSGNARRQTMIMQNDLAYAKGLINQLRNGEVPPSGKEADDVRRVLQDIRQNGSDKQLLAAALVAQGDYDWALAHYPEPSAAATQPSPRPAKSPADLLKSAKEAYQQVISQYADQTIAVVAARMSLASIAEDEGNWDEAQRQLEAVKSMNDSLEAVKVAADNKLKLLEKLRAPLLVGIVPDKPEPTTDPLASLLTTKPTTAVTTRKASTTLPAVPGKAHPATKTNPAAVPPIKKP